MRSRLSAILMGLGIILLVYAIFGRYVVLPGYLETLAQGRTTLGSVNQAVSPWNVARYLLWAYSFKLGIYMFVLGAIFRVKMSVRWRWAVALGGLVYIAFAYVPLPTPTSPVFGIAGGIMTLFMIYIFLRWAKDREKLEETARKKSDFLLVGYFFFGMATYTLCPLMVVKAFALSPEKMIAYGLQSEAASFALHLLIELLLGWAFVALSFRVDRRSLQAGQ